MLWDWLDTVDVVLRDLHVGFRDGLVATVLSNPRSKYGHWS
tara:strand:- start:569 stop:691 length:123 start_codon:yes stop_codon:yes gene_type:complete